MPQKLLLKIGYCSIFEDKTSKGTEYLVDSGKTIRIERFNKTVINPYRIQKKFKTLTSAKKFAKAKITKSTEEKKKKTEKLPKSLYLVLLKEESTNKFIVKVGITSKRYIYRRFSKDYGYVGYTLDTILRRIDTRFAEKLESEIKDTLNKKGTIKKYRPLMENFSGYTECYDYECLKEILNIFDSLTKDC